MESNDDEDSAMTVNSDEFSPLTSADFERSFSMLKDIYCDNRACFTELCLSMHMIVQCNAAM